MIKSFMSKILLRLLYKSLGVKKTLLTEDSRFFTDMHGAEEVLKNRRTLQLFALSSAYSIKEFVEYLHYSIQENERSLVQEHDKFRQELLRAAVLYKLVLLAEMKTAYDNYKRQSPSEIVKMKQSLRKSLSSD